jgi:hypothetical protein
MDPSVRFLLGNDVPETEGATIHPITPPVPVSIDEDKIGFTVDVAGRLDREQTADVAPRAVIVPIVEAPPLADSA